MIFATLILLAIAIYLAWSGLRERKLYHEEQNRTTNSSLKSATPSNPKARWQQVQ